MSSRIRILFHYAPEGSLAHVGLRALRAMEGLTRPTTQEWLERQNIPPKSPRPLKTRLRLKPGPYGMQTVKEYLIEMPATSPLPAHYQNQRPAFKNAVERAKWLWQHLPSEVQQISHLIITREPRRARWSRSMANPRHYGWAQVQLGAAPSGDYVWHNPWSDFGAGISGIIKEEPQTSTEVPQSYYAGVLEAVKTANQHHPVPKKPSWPSGISSLAEDNAFEVEPPLITAPHPAPKLQPAKVYSKASPLTVQSPQPKKSLRIGIWS